MRSGKVINNAMEKLREEVIAVEVEGRCLEYEAEATITTLIVGDHGGG